MQEASAEQLQHQFPALETLCGGFGLGAVAIQKDPGSWLNLLNTQLIIEGRPNIVRDECRFLLPPAGSTARAALETDFQRSGVTLADIQKYNFSALVGHKKRWRHEGDSLYRIFKQGSFHILLVRASPQADSNQFVLWRVFADSAIERQEYTAFISWMLRVWYAQTPAYNDCKRSGAPKDCPSYFAGIDRAVYDELRSTFGAQKQTQGPLAGSAGSETTVPPAAAEHGEKDLQASSSSVETNEL